MGVLSSKRDRIISQEPSMPLNPIHPLLGQLRTILGKRNLITDPAARVGIAPDSAMARGRRCAWRCQTILSPIGFALEAAIAADASIIMQAAHTGLTGGSTPLRR